jgi:hypothetical protein
MRHDLSSAGASASGLPGHLTRMDPGHMVDNDIWQLGWHE